MLNITGMLFALLSAVANGTFAVPSKLPRVTSTGIAPPIFNLYLNFGVAVSSLAILLLLPTPAPLLTWQGLAGGLLLALSSLMAMRAVQMLGVSTAAGVWSGTAVLVSFLFGHFFQERVREVWVSIGALGVLLASICAMAYAERAAEREAEVWEKEREGEEVGGAYEPVEDGIGASETKTSKPTFQKGILAAVLTGLFGGLVLAPETFAPKEAQGLGFIPSFGIGVLLFGPIVNLLPNLLRREMPDLHLRETLLFGLLAGFIWSLSNICSILALQKVGYSVAYPTMQCGLFVAGVWGIFLFGEIQGSYRRLYWVSGIALLSGIFLLSYAK